MWKITKRISNSLKVFVNRCLRCILIVKWVDKIPNEALWQRTKSTPIQQQIKERKWRWIGHTLRKPQDAIERHALNWNRQGTRRGRGQTKNKLEKNRRGTAEGRNKLEAKGLALDRTKWKSVVKVLCST
jgi:hypothetical protein